MKPVLADSSYYVALLSPSDMHHAAAKELSETLLGRTFVTEYVLVELGSLLARGDERRGFLMLLDRITADPLTSIVPGSTELFRRGLALFADRPDKNWSLTDCISFVVMKQRRLIEALTADHHFEQAGFKALLK